MRARRQLSTVILAGALLVAGITSGCGSSQITYTIGDGGFAGPSMTLEQGAMTRIARFTVPTGGWSVRLDRTERVFGGHRAYVTLVKPSPGTLTTQALVTHSVNLETPLGENVAVYARTIERNVEADADIDRIYRYAGGEGMDGDTGTGGRVSDE